MVDIPSSPPALALPSDGPSSCETEPIDRIPNQFVGLTGAKMSVPVAARSNVLVCGPSPAEIVGSNPTGGHECLSVVSVVCCQVGVSVTS